MPHPRALIAVAILIAGATACQSESAKEASSPLKVVFRSTTPAAVVETETGLAVGPDGAAPEVIVLADPAPETEARRERTRRPARGPEIVYRTVYIEEAPEAVDEDEQPAEESSPATTPEPIVEPDRAPVEPDQAPIEPDPVAADPAPVPTTFPDGGSSRTEDAILGAAVGASIGAILGGRNGAISGGVGGAIGGAVGGRRGGILGGVLGAGGRGRRGGGSCFVANDFVPGSSIEFTRR